MLSLSLCLFKHNTMKTYGGVEVRFWAFVTSAPYSGHGRKSHRWFPSTFPLNCFTPSPAFSSTTFTFCRLAIQFTCVHTATALPSVWQSHTGRTTTWLSDIREVNPVSLQFGTVWNKESNNHWTSFFCTWKVPSLNLGRNTNNSARIFCGFKLVPYANSWGVSQ